MPSQVRCDSFLGVAAVVCSQPMQDLMQTVRRIANTDLTVLITGESGSGKEIVARALHHYSRRSKATWVDINCAALPEHLVESELFGYEKGAFSGADAPKQGLFELAHEGSIYLDEIGELDARAQAKLLRILDGMPYLRLGGVRKVILDVRVIAATNQDLEQSVARAKFREDLYHRLSQVRIHVPPLRERADDVIPLAEHFLRIQNDQLRLTGDAVEALLRYCWPGNVRELRNMTSRAAALATGSVIRASDLGLETAEGKHPASDSWEFTANLQALERRTIMKVLEQTGGQHRRAAGILGISPRTLSRKLAAYEIGNVTSLTR
jgi:transcriptional regulator with PAS, ATPase and Fis domain